ncbi:unnamed protein product [Orchesella dallaii]|uniref:F-box domain-containing protein n=1 Tax=Orchesella dallaii TaxID=48710 RepID=A0ABP1S5U2_9HEXA
MDLLSRILAHLSQKDDMNHVQLVCQRWHSVVDETIGREISICTLTNGNTIDDYQYHPTQIMGNLEIDVISKMGVKTCFLELTDCSEEEDDNESKPDDTSKWPTFKFPHLLKHLYLNGMILPGIFHNLIFEVQNLTVLELTLLGLSQLNASDLEKLHLPNLLELGVRRCVKHFCREFKDEIGLRNLRILLKNSFPRLTQLDIRFPILGFNDFSTLKILLKFLALHHDTLKKLYLIMEFPVQVNKIPVSATELEILELARKFRSCQKLEFVEIQGIRLHASYPQIKLWLAFVQQQRCLKSITLRLGNIHEHDLRLICEENASTLEHLYLFKFQEKEEENTPVILNAGIFSLTKRLETLYVLGSDLVVGAHELPLSLSSIFITGAIKTEQVYHILFNLPNLKFISLKNAYDQRDLYGVTLDILTQFIEARKVKRLILSGSSLCKELPVNGLPNGDPENPAQLTEFESWDALQDFIDWELNASMYYINKCY